MLKAIQTFLGVLQTIPVSNESIARLEHAFTSSEETSVAYRRIKAESQSNTGKNFSTLECKASVCKSLFSMMLSYLAF